MADQKDYNTVKAKFDRHFVKKHNVIYKRVRFNMCKQEEGETVDSFITALYALAEHCAYGSLHDEMIHDRLVVGLGSAMLSEKLQLDSELTLEKSVMQARLQEAVKLQQSVVRDRTRVKPDTPVSVVSQVEPHQQSGGRANRPRESRGPRTLSNNQSNGACSKCGLTPLHDSARCPTREGVRRRCKKRGHYQRVCRSHIKVAMVEEGQDAFLGTLGSQTSGDTWQVKVLLNNTPVMFQMTQEPKSQLSPPVCTAS